MTSSSRHIVAVALLLSVAIAAAEPVPKETQTADAQAQTGNIPQPIWKAMRDGLFAEKYDVSFHLSPFYLRGDFDGDGKIDVAVLVKQRATGKLGIAIFHGVTGKATILGAGTSIGNGGDDFSWMDTWQVYSKTRGAHAAGESGAPKLRGDALLVGKSQAASALIYWNGKRYVWLQQGD
jgi:hypothetical protein